MNRFLLKGLMTVLAVFMFQTADAQNKPVRKPADGNMYTSAVRQKAAQSDEGEWKPLGKGLFRDDMITTLYIVDNYEFEVDVEENSSKPGLYRLVTPYKNYPISPSTSEVDTYMEIDATDPDKVFFRRYDTGMDWGGGNIYINSMAGDYYDKGEFEKAVEEGICGKLQDGAITFPQSTLLIADETMGSTTTYRIANSNGKFRLKLPGAPELDVEAAIKGKVEKDGELFVAVNFTMEKDVEKIKIAMFEGDYTQDMADGITDGSTQSTEMTASGEQLIPYEKDGVYTFVAVPYYKGEPKNAIYVTDELSYLQVDWKDVGTAFYTDGYLCDTEGISEQMGIGVETTEVQVQESTKTPGLFRLVDPYGLNYRYSNEQNYDTSHRYYMEIDASDPDRVIIKNMEDGCGLIFSALGRMQLWCNADRWITEGTYTKEEVEQMNVYGKFKDKVITFPDGALCMKFMDVVDTWYWSNMSGTFKLVLPVGAGIDTPATVDEENAPAEYFTLEGVKISKGALRPGIYVKKQGTSSSKIIIK